MEASPYPGEPVTCTAHCCKESIRSPRPVPNDWIDETCYSDAIEEVADKCRAADHRAGRNSRARVCKCKLEDPDREERYACSLISGGRPLQEEPVIADQSVAVAEHECEAPGVKQNA